SRPEYLKHAHAAGALHLRRLALERLLCVSEQPFTLRGYNALIDRVVDYRVDFNRATRDEAGILIPQFRETLVCPVTGLNARARMVLLAARRLLGEERLRSADIYLTEATTPFYRAVAAINPRVQGSEYFGADATPGEVRRGIRHQDVTHLSFPDHSFDLIVTNDVLEHVPDYTRAMRELNRVLKPGGILLVTVPFHEDVYNNEIRARLTAAGAVEHLMTPPEYHDDPVNPAAGVLCYQVFGWKILDDLREAGFA